MTDEQETNHTFARSLSNAGLEDADKKAMIGCMGCKYDGLDPKRKFKCLCLHPEQNEPGFWKRPDSECYTSPDSFFNDTNELDF